jgi:hypothetical protein
MATGNLCIVDYNIIGCIAADGQLIAFEHERCARGWPGSHN